VYAVIGSSLLAAACGGAGTGAVGAHHHRLRPGPAHAATSTTSTTTTTKGTSAGPAATVAPTSGPTGAVAPVATGSGFHGIYEFAGGNSSTDADNPDLAGVVLVYYWSQIEPARGTFDWSVIEDDMAPWVAAGKKVILRISTSGAAQWDPPYSGNGTPPWVYADGTRAISDNGESIPVYWDPTYLNDYEGFVQSFAAQFDGNPNVAFIEAGIGMGGETLPETNASTSGVASWEADGYSDALWLNTVEKIASLFQSSFHSTPIFPLVDMTFFDGNVPDYDTLVSWFKSVPHWGLQYDGLSSTSTLSPEWSGRPIALEQRSSTQTSGDCLCSDISNGLTNLHGNYLLIYRSDIDDPANSAYLTRAAEEAS
jgi:hypothetical protein